MTVQEFFLLLMSVLSSVGGQFFLKLGAIKLGRVNFDNVFSHIINIITIPELIGGLTFYALGALAYILLLTRVHLSIVGPSVSIVYVFSVLLGYFAFKESIPATRILGLGLITCGVMLVLWKR